MENKTIAESLKPTIENVTNEFITDAMYEILFEKEMPNFKFDFKEKEAIEFIENILRQYSNKYNFYYQESENIIKSLKDKSKRNGAIPVMVISDYKKFFELLRQIYEKDIELFFKRSGRSGFPVYEMENLFKDIWLRAVPEDFNNPEEFLKKQNEMIRDNTLEEYDQEKCFGQVQTLDNNFLCVKNEIARSWDENFKQMVITIYDKNYYYNTELCRRPQYNLPVVRYGIYEGNGKKICQIGSIQNIYRYDKEQDYNKKMDKKRYKLNKNVPEEYTSSVEPKNLLALSIFINLLHRKGIDEVEVPSMYVLDYEYHKKFGDELKRKFDEKWTDKEQKKSPMKYKEQKKILEKYYNKEELISEIKSERLIKTFNRLMYHYPNSKVKSYPIELDSNYHLKIPIVNDKSEIRGDMLREIFSLVQENDIERQKGNERE